MHHHIEFTDDLMTVLDADGNGYDAFDVDPDQPWDAIETLAEWGRRYPLDACQALKQLRAYLRDCQ